jgi:hypothetical protein
VVYDTSIFPAWPSPSERSPHLVEHLVGPGQGYPHFVDKKPRLKHLLNYIELRSYAETWYGQSRTAVQFQGQVLIVFLQLPLWKMSSNLTHIAFISFVSFFLERFQGQVFWL